MRKLFEIGLNDDGFYVFPYTNPPRHNAIHGDEVTLNTAIELCDALNRAVETYLSLISQHNQDHTTPRLLRLAARGITCFASVLNSVAPYQAPRGYAASMGWTPDTLKALAGKLRKASRNPGISIQGGKTHGDE